MLFSSPVFVYYFLPFVLIGHFLLPRGKNAFLLGASLIFYAWGEPTYVAIIFASILINYTAGLLLARTLPPQAARTVPGTGRAAKAVLIAAVALNLGMLAFFKYFHFIVENMNLVLRLVWPTAQWHPSFTVALPLGISFFTFQAFSYTIDVYRRDTPATANLINFAAYITMFPQLVAGPIVRYVDVARELIHRQITLPACSYGVRRFIFGLGKKMLVANEMGYIADQVFDIPANELTPSMAWLGIVAYTLQIYFDFSGYSDMAIGMGRMLGFNFLENFTHPYAADSIRDFWRRWHISLSTWFRDYLYIPLGGNKASRWKTYRNLLLVFFLCGLWHGASWSFVIWGLYHGVFLVLERGPMGRFLDR
ncbi:MAG: MBOAT family protein, partial [Candidatus Hydrogenedentes bacterium]|nr:MBOAT family protein [Candidatus Hydrogenedentota bacterium]